MCAVFIAQVNVISYLSRKKDKLIENIFKIIV